MPSWAVASRLKQRSTAAKGTSQLSQVQRSGHGPSCLEATAARARRTKKASGVLSRIISGKAYQTPRVLSRPIT
jgi:hypothetical protein